MSWNVYGNIKIAAVDFFGILLIVFNTDKLLKGNYKNYIPILVLATSLSLGFFVSQKPITTALEVASLLYLGMLYHVLLFVIDSLEKLIYVLKVISLVAVLFFLLSFIIPQFSVYSAGFRNYGQYGYYNFFLLFIFFPIIMERNLKEKINDKWILFFYFLVGVSIFSIYLTLKLSILISLIVALIGYLVLFKKWFILIAFILLFVSFLCFFEELVVFIPDGSRLAYRVSHKINQFSPGGLYQIQFRKAYEVFLLNPILGTGMGGYGGIYNTHEVHSNYLKLLFEGGIIGFVAYIYFMIKEFGIRVYKEWKKNSSVYIAYLFPFIFGFIVASAYTYHLRKRIFWIAAFIVVWIIDNKSKWNNTVSINKNK